MDIVKIAENTIKNHRMLKKGDRVLVGLSGGADSAALLHILLRLAPVYELKIACAHINHSLRETADRDMLFCEQLCKELGVEFFSITEDIKSGAANAGMSEELYARKVRYEYFESLGFDKIATAHNKNDAAETILFNFMRGASAKGLSGIPYVRGNIIRPILDIKKKDITRFCEENGYRFVTDETNFEEIYTRNKIRLGMIPKIEEEFNPAFVDVVTQNAQLFKEDSQFLEDLAQKSYTGEIMIDEFEKEAISIKRRILQLHWKRCAQTEKNLAFSYINDLLTLIQKNKTGKKVDLPCGFEARCEYGKMLIQKRCQKSDYEYKIYPEKVLNIPETGKNILIRKVNVGGSFYLDEAEELVVRNRHCGDIFYPVGMCGKKKLSDFFTDKKIPAKQRDEIPILVSGGKIVSVGDIRCDRRFYDKEKNMYKIEIKEAHDAE